MNTKIVTYTGKSFDLLNPTPEMVCIEDIARSLSLLCRYTGHTKEFYSVAQHCVLMVKSNLFNDPLAVLLHDAAEAYIGDMSSPWKQLLWIHRFRGSEASVQSVKDYENRIQKVIGTALGVDLSHSPEVKEIDNRMYATEIRDLMPESEEFGKWRGNLKPFDFHITPWEWFSAEQIFLRTYYELKETK